MLVLVLVLVVLLVVVWWVEGENAHLGLYAFHGLYAFTAYTPIGLYALALLSRPIA